MGGQPVEAVVFEGFVTAVGVVGTNGVARCVIVVAGGMARASVTVSRSPYSV